MCKYALRIGLPYIPHLLSMTFLNFIDRIMITKMCNQDATAIYSLGYTCATIIVVLMTSYNSAFSPWLAKKLEQNSDDVKKVSYQYIVWFIIPVFGVLLLVPELIFVLGGPEYKDAVTVALVVSVGVVFQFIYTMYVNIEQYYKKTIGMAVASVIAAILNLALNYIFIPVYGFQAAAVTTLVGYMTLLILHMFLVRRMRKNQLYPTGKIIITALFVLIMMVLFVFLYQFTWLRYIITIIYYQ
jgi:O-antigen/teichoic acid export membrane protein